MTLQELLMQKIDTYSGIEKLTQDMERLRLLTNNKKWFNNMIIYFNGLYNQVIDAEEIAITYRQSSLDTIAFLKKFNTNRNDPTITFLVALITFKLAYVSEIRRIT